MIGWQKHSSLVTVLTGLSAVITVCVGIGVSYSNITAQYGPLPAKVSALESTVAILQKKNAEIESGVGWTGYWSGQWDEKYFVEFNIFCAYGGRCLIAERHVEHLPESDDATSIRLEPASIMMGIVEGDTMRMGDVIVVHKTSPNTANAMGAFLSGHSRHATLTKSDSSN